MRFHIHHDPNWQAEGCWIYHTCSRCGARRIHRRYVNMMGPAEPGWDELLRDRHGRHLNDSGWVA